MVCILCGEETRVTNSRPGKRGASVWRRRECPGCLTVFSSREKPDLSLSIRFKKENEPLRPFSEDKLFISVIECLTHRKEPLRDARELTITIVGKLLPIHSSIVTSTEVASAAHQVLKKFDKAAATYYAAHHQIK